MKLDVTKQFSTRSDRVKGIDFHPSEPWILTTLYNGKVEIWLYATNTLVKSIQVTDLPIRAGRFIARKNWIVVGADDFQVRVYNYNTGEKITQFEAHPDYIRSIAVHATLPYVLTSSDDLTIKLWNWESGWRLEQTYEGHQHYIMCVNFNPKDPNTFALACLDRTVKVWLLSLPTANYTMVAHDVKGVNYVDYYPHADKPYLITASDDKTVKIWDYQTKACVAVLEGHLANVSFAIFHPELPLVVSGSEDGTVRFWNANTFKLEKSVNYGLDRVWCVAVLARSNLVAVGCDCGYVAVKLGNEEPLFSMDPAGKLLYARNADVFQTALRALAADSVRDGEVVPLQARELGSVDVYPQTLAHLPNGRYAAVCGDGEYTVYTALAWRSKAYGKALDFAWNTHDTSNATSYAVRESKLAVKVLRNFQESHSVDLVYEAERLFGGALLGVRSAGLLCFYDWESGALVRRVDIDDEVHDVVWAANGELVAVLTAGDAGETYVLGFDRAVYEDAVAEGSVDPQEGCADAFAVVDTVPEPVVSGQFIGDVLVYTTASHRLNYFVGGEVVNLSHFDHRYYVVGYRATEGRVFLLDKACRVVSWYVNAQVLELQTLVVRGDLEQFALRTVVDADGAEVPDVASVTRESLLPEYASYLDHVSSAELNQLARFFEKLGYLQLALALLTDLDSRFVIALRTRDLALAHRLLQDAPADAAAPARWRRLGDAASAAWDIRLAEACYWAAADHALLLLVLLSTGDRAKLARLGAAAQAAGQCNVAFQAWWQAGEVGACVALLAQTERASEAAFLGRTYGEDIGAVVAQWRTQLEGMGREKLAARLELAAAANGTAASANGHAQESGAEAKETTEKELPAAPAAEVAEVPTEVPTASTAAPTELSPEVSPEVPEVSQKGAVSIEDPEVSDLPIEDLAIEEFATEASPQLASTSADAPLLDL